MSATWYMLRHNEVRSSDLVWSIFRGPRLDGTAVIGTLAPAIPVRIRHTVKPTLHADMPTWSAWTS